MVSGKAGEGRAQTPEGAPILARGPAAGPPKPAQQRPELPEFWDQRFASGTTPWDAGGVPAQLAAFAAAHGEQPRTLIPGCGAAYEAAFLDRLGWPVLALDFSAQAVAAARSQLDGFRGQLVHGDFFDFADAGGFALIYERAFLCALPRKLWPAYARRCAELLPAGGLLAGYFYCGEEGKGPPFAITPAALDALLSPAFKKLDDRPSSDAVAVFKGCERWQVWRRRARA